MKETMIEPDLTKVGLWQHYSFKRSPKRHDSSVQDNERNRGQTDQFVWDGGVKGLRNKLDNITLKHTKVSFSFNIVFWHP